MLDFKRVELPALRSGLVAIWLSAIAPFLGACQPADIDADPEAEAPAAAASSQPSAALDNASFRDQLIASVRQIASSGPLASCDLPSPTSPLFVVVSMYYGGKLEAQGTSSRDELCAALSEATLEARSRSKLDQDRMSRARFVVELSNHKYGAIEYEGRGLELKNGIMPVRTVSKAALAQYIDAGKKYLLRVIDPRLGGTHKYYQAADDNLEPRLHTIYTASTIYTLLALYEHDHDEALREHIDRAAEFLLEMQQLAPDQPGYGGFFYSLDTTHEQPEPRLVVGTTSKTIFTLIQLHELTQDPKYMRSAKLAASWLMSMQSPDGHVTPELHQNAEGEWEPVERESMLYTGQVLSALSRMYLATKDATYLEAASRTAGVMLAKIEAEGCYLGDEYRSPNPVSSSWTILSLFDYARASGDLELRRKVYACTDELLSRQIHKPEDTYRHGRWTDSMSSSGSGWMAEVLAVLYLDCEATTPGSCDRYRDAIVSLFRLLMQSTYTPENSYAAANPDMANGGMYWSPLDRRVRTDSVCHAMNAYVFMIDHLPDEVLLELPEAPLETLFNAP
ncbi:glycoside hydrolase family 127 protein [Pseudenhygromyxa sp. WMMC2535]|uniref:beta-L-arabinofuranosidase domain-containing protein n=1 Tax=Pseudenhygromyxa sp. WMMC2535 TaxID=2712867 RepID=UPI001595E2D2|nr:beta-L-arabinofuranosidase domain-containing protein [Pseudenhygromyxa sp. WMMC2535]NVB37570.1 glycoside hydrolase family 127 protein [Pseudenhygromyxa sp. WMMC2535]